MNKCTVVVAIVSIAIAIMAIMFVYSSLDKERMTEESCRSNGGIVKTDNIGQRFCEFRTGAWLMLD